MTTTTEHDWYVVRCFGNYEKKVKEHLEEQIRERGLQHKIEEVLVPTENVVVIRAGKKVTQERNFYPGYILLHTTYDSEVNDLVSDTPNCMGFLRDRGKQDPAPLRAHEVKEILGRVRDNRDLLERGGAIDIPFREGDLVKVIDGPFKEFDGTVQEVNPDKLKLRVLVSIFGRRTPVEVDINQVEKLR